MNPGYAPTGSKDSGDGGDPAFSQHSARKDPLCAVSEDKQVLPNGNLPVLTVINQGPPSAAKSTLPAHIF